ncbi:MAG: hypothetical protein IJC25_01405 [Clostridia bacterium]|nr:hypothetical protein [Clostridia bacterium]
MKTVYRIIQVTWGFLQTLIGLMVYCKNRKCRHFIHKGAIYTEWPQRGGISLGLFVFVQPDADEYLIAHEYGHTLQSLMLGPLYLPLIGLPSLIWSRLPYFRKMRKEKQISYYSLYCEKWANRLGGLR